MQTGGAGHRSSRSSRSNSEAACFLYIRTYTVFCFSFKCGVAGSLCSFVHRAQQLSNSHLYEDAQNPWRYFQRAVSETFSKSFSHFQHSPQYIIINRASEVTQESRGVNLLYSNSLHLHSRLTKV